MEQNINILDIIKIKEYNDDEFFGQIKRLEDSFESRAPKVDLVQDFLLFNPIYRNTKGKNQDIRFYLAFEKLEEISRLLEEKEGHNIDQIYEGNKKIFDDIKNKLINNDKISDKFFETLKYYINFEENKELFDNLFLLFNSKKYELDIKSIIYFFNYLNKEDEWLKNLSKNYSKLSEMNLNELKKNLKEFPDNKIFDYQEKNTNYLKLFRALYEKRESIDFLNEKTNSDIIILYDRMDPNSPTITIQNLYDIKKCIEVFIKN